MHFNFTTPINNAVIGARNHNMRKVNAQEWLAFKEEKVNDQKRVVAGITAEMNKTTDPITYRFLEDKLRCAKRDLHMLEDELEKCHKEVHGSAYQEYVARTTLLVENNGVQRAADMIMNDEFAKMEAELSSSAAKERSDP